MCHMVHLPAAYSAAKAVSSAHILPAHPIQLSPN